MAMNINSIGINAYRQTTAESQIQKKNGTAVDNKPQADGVTIPGQENNITSKLAVQLKRGKFADMLTNEERQALELIFEKFRLAGLENENYGDKKAPSTEHLGKIVDVKL
jgi:hypothetical protein